MFTVLSIHFVPFCWSFLLFVFVFSSIDVNAPPFAAFCCCRDDDTAVPIVDALPAPAKNEAEAGSVIRFPFPKGT